jgi:hypothetical protein
MGYFHVTLAPIVLSNLMIYSTPNTIARDVNFENMYIYTHTLTKLQASTQFISKQCVPFTLMIVGKIVTPSQHCEAPHIFNPKLHNLSHIYMLATIETTL